MMKKYLKSEDMLALIKAGLLISSAFIAPGSVKYLGKLLTLDDFDEYYPSQLRTTLKRLERRQLISIIDKGDKTEIVLSDKGKNELLSYEIAKMKINIQNRWDGKWRVVIFDVPNTRKKYRDAFMKKLKDLGFYQFQESVYFYPYPCEKEIEFIRNYYGVAKETTYLLVEKVEDDSFLRSKFNI